MKTSQNLDRSIKRDRTVFASAAQVYNGNGSENVTKPGHFKNLSCTYLQFVAVLFTCWLIVPCISGAQAQTISNDPGGIIITYVLKVAKLRRAGEQVRFTGICNSACTLHLSLPAHQLCVSPGASFGFHLPFGAGTDGDRAAANFIMYQYPQWVRNWIASKGGLSNRVITMNYNTAKQHLRQCA